MVRTVEGGRETWACSAMEGLEFMDQPWFQFQTMVRLPVIVKCHLSILKQIMLKLFFQKKNDNQQLNLPNSETYVQVSNNLDSQFYSLERVKDGDNAYLLSNYFLESHPQLVNYFTSWHEQETLQQDPPLKKPKEEKHKRSIMGGGGFLSKKSKVEGKPSLSKELTEQVLTKSVVQNVLYVQLQTFSQVNRPNSLEEVKQFMALIYLLALRVHHTFNCWPRMIPVVVESQNFKFLKKGKSLYHQLVSLFAFLAKYKRQTLLEEWSHDLAVVLAEPGSEEKNEIILGEFLKKQIEKLLERQFSLRLKKGHEMIPQTVLILDPFTLVLKEETFHVKVDEYETSYYQQNADSRQVVMQHSIQNAVVLQGNRNNLVIRYLKQFMIT